MTHFVARFPQHSQPVQNPTPADYHDAAVWYRNHYIRLSLEWNGKRLLFKKPDIDIFIDWKEINGLNVMLERAESFERVYRRLQWAQRKPGGCNEAERA